MSDKSRNQYAAEAVARALYPTPNGVPPAVHDKVVFKVAAAVRPILDAYCPEPQDTESDYFDAVQSIADEATEAAREDYEANESEDSAREAADTLIHESVGGSYWVIYYHAARKALIYSDNEDAGFNEGVFDPGSFDNMGALRTAAAYYAMCADVRDWLDLETMFEEVDATREEDEDEDA